MASTMSSLEEWVGSVYLEGSEEGHWLALPHLGGPFQDCAVPPKDPA